MPILFNPLKQYRVLIADADAQLAQVLKWMLGEMGFPNVHMVRTGQAALEELMEAPPDFLITEWNIAGMDGIDLIDRIRRDTHSPNPTLPIIMLTGRAEESDVMTARDHGINEYVIKPFSARTIYSRLERIVEQPRNFVVAKDFIGPDRRHRGTPPKGMPDRRTLVITPQRKPRDPAGELHSGDEPKIWVDDFALKRKLGPDTNLSSLITPAVLNLAQASIDAISTDSLQWIKQNLKQLKAVQQAMMDGRNLTTIAANMSEVALAINSRAGTFGYTFASDVAYMLYLFCRKNLQPQKEIHRIITQKHIEVLQVILSKSLRGEEDGELAEIITELRNLVEKYGN